MPYEISADFDDAQRNTIQTAIDHWNDRTIRRLVPRSGEVDHVVFEFADESCSSSVGRTSGRQTIRCDVGDGFGRGSMIHEIGHAVRYWHEHTRPDRDSFVSVDESNVKADKLHNYEKLVTGLLLTAYDYKSIMHYRRTGSFAIDSSNDIITPLDAEASIGQRNGLSELDRLGVLRLYDTPHYAVAWEDDRNTNGKANILWGGLTRWGKHCALQQPKINETSRDNRAPAIAVDADGNSIVAFEHRTQSKIHISMSARRADGNQHFGGDHHSSDSSTTNRSPEVDVHSSGDFVLVWQETDNNRVRIKGQGYVNSGHDRFAAQTLAPDDTGTPGLPTVRMANNRSFIVTWGEFFVCWERQLADVFVAGFAADDTPLFGPMNVASSTTGRQFLPDIAYTTGGAVVVVWTDDRNQNGMGQIRARVLAADDTELKSDFTVNQRGCGTQRRPRVAAAYDGGFVVTWEDDEGNDGVFQIHAQVFDSSWASTGPNRTVNLIPTGQQRAPATDI
ncbi:MAG: hypothetical protein ACI8Y4_003845 [Candidatus Poriferisodalaceae bacterium]|jgi:hypothetical protein